jgi:hypothetical protein
MNHKKTLQQGISICLLITAAMLPIAGISNPAQVSVTMVRHGVHPGFERVVFDVTGSAKYQIEPLPGSGDLRVTIIGTNPKSNTPEIQLSSKAELIIGITAKKPGLFDISALSPAKASSFVIPGKPFRIVVDLYPEEVPTATARVAPSEPPKPSVSPKQNPPPPIPATKPETPTSVSLDTTTAAASAAVSHDSTYDFNTLYNLKQAALNWQTMGRTNQAVETWERFLTKAKELRLAITGNDFSYDDKAQQAKNRTVRPFFAVILKYLHIILPVTLTIVLVALWLVRRRMKPKLVEESVEEPEPVPKPLKKQVVAKEPESEETPEEKPKKIQETAEPVEEPKTPDTAIEQQEDDALNEFFEGGEEASDQERKVQRILELAGAEKSVAEIAEEMGIGEDEVRLVLDLQGDRAKTEVAEET